MPTLEPIDEYDKVREFLNSISRNSIQTQKVYTFSLSHFQTFLKDSEYKKYNTETILRELIGRDIDVYSLLNNFVGYLIARDTKLSYGSITLYLAGVRSYLEYYDIDLSSKKFKARVKLPKKLTRNDEGAIDAEDIRTILLSCTNETLKTFLLLLGCTGLRANEALSLRGNDLDFNQSPTKVHIRAETTKTGRTRDIYISDECTKELKKFISSKSPNDLIFSKEGQAQTISIYKRLREHFTKVLDKVEMNKRKEGQGKQRREITFHSFRRYVYTTLCNSEGGQSYAEDFIGHSGSTYHRMKQEKKRQMYIESMKYLTFLEYHTVESIGSDLKAKLKEKDQEIGNLLQEVYWQSEELEYIKKYLNIEYDSKSNKKNSKLKKR